MSKIKEEKKRKRKIPLLHKAGGSSVSCVRIYKKGFLRGAKLKEQGRKAAEVCVVCAYII